MEFRTISLAWRERQVAHYSVPTAWTAGIRKAFGTPMAANILRRECTWPMATHTRAIARRYLFSAAHILARSTAVDRFGAQVGNLFNHANYAPPFQLTLGVPGFAANYGHVNSGGASPRAIQLTARFSF